MYRHLDSYFGLSKAGTSVRTEILAGLTTFSTMAYIVFVNPLILSKAGMDFGSVMVATILAALISTLMMGLYANYPFAQAPGMGLNAYFAYGVVMGAGHSWQGALGACTVAGVIFLLLNFLGIRRAIVEALPSSIRIGVSAGIGLFLAFIGLKNIDLIAPHPETLVTLGNIDSSSAVLAGLGLVVTVGLMVKGVGPAILIGILLNWALGLGLGLVEWQGVVSAPPSVAPTFLQLDIWEALHPNMMGIVIAFVFIALFDTAGTLVGLASQAGFLDKEGKLPRTKEALYSDAYGTIAGGLTGTSPITTFLESASGIAVGGRTGLTAVVVALLFGLSLFFSPLAASIPLFATTPVLLIIGAFMLRALRDLDWDDVTELVPAFVTFLTIPLTFSIASGVGLGFIVHPLIKTASGRGREVHWIVWVLAAVFAVKFCWIPD